jgi:galactose mutarotase-like enzyme
MTITLENDRLKVAIKTKGAELCSVVRKDNRLEYVWSGDPAIWGKTSPVLFPVVGTLKENIFIYNGNSYTLLRHGFARDAEFEIVAREQQHAILLLKDSAASFKNYPFNFELLLKYELDNDLLKVTYEVRNTGTGKMYFSIGAHPAFKVPLTEGTIYEDYYLQFDYNEDAGRWPINKDGLIEQAPVSFFNNSFRVDLNRALFQNDALVFKHLHSHKVSLKTSHHAHGLDFYFERFPYLGLWAAKGGNFVCIEPWCGIADSVDHDQQLINKEGIETLPASDTWERQWKRRFF